MASKRGGSRVIENMKILAYNTFLCRTQAGFRKAVKCYVGDDDSTVGERYWDYPKSYPSVVKFFQYYEGFHGIGCNSVHLNKYREGLLAQLKQLEDE